MKKTFTFIFLSFFISVSHANKGNELSIAETDDDEKVDVTVNVEEDFSKGRRTFIATEEWQEIQDDQMIPPGLHIRMNMQTGKKEAKLMDGGNSPAGSLEDVMKTAIEDAMKELKVEAKKDEDDFKYWNFNGQKGIMKNKDTNFTIDELKKALKKFTETEKELNREKNISNLEEDSNLKFRSIEEINEDFQNMNITIKTDSEIVKQLAKKMSLVQQKSDLLKQEMASMSELDQINEEKVNILGALEDYLHQIDNANTFVDEGGLDMMWLEMGEANEAVKTAVMVNIAALTQNNPHTQVALVKTSFPEAILNCIISNTSSTSFSLLQIASLSALSASIRGFPLAQQKVVEKYGFHKIIHLFTKKLDQLNKDAGNNAVKSFIKFSRHFVNLVTDIWEEKVQNELDDQISDKLKEMKTQQYDRVKLLEQLKASGWCDLIGAIFTHVDNFDVRQAVLQAMKSFQQQCPSYPAEVKQQLELFSLKLLDLMEDGDTYFKELYAIIESLMRT